MKKEKIQTLKKLKTKLSSIKQTKIPKLNNHWD